MATHRRSDPKEKEPKAAGAPQADKPVEERRHFIAEWVVTILIVLFGTTTLLQAFVVPTGSMEGTMLIGDHLLVDKLAYSPHGSLSSRVLPYSDVKRGDIIVFRWPLDVKQAYVKRVIGVPGDRIRFINKQLFVNGERLEEPYVELDPHQTSAYLNNFPRPPDILIDARAIRMLEHVQSGELVVPPDQYFALGDSRDNSADSRFWGFVPRENIIGKPLLIFWSYDAPTEHLAESFNLDHLADLAKNFFTKTRWSRTLKLVRGHDLRAR